MILASAIDLKHRAFFLGATADGLVAASEDGHVSVIDGKSASTYTFNLKIKIRKLRAHPTKPLLAVIDDQTGKLLFFDMAGKLLAIEFRKPSDPSLKTWPGKLEDICFCNDGQSMITVTQSGTVVLEMFHVDFDTAKFVEVASAEVDDPFGNSSCLFFPTKEPNTNCLWLAAGQDGTATAWVYSNDGGLHCQIDDQLSDTCPPAFAPSGNKIISVSDEKVTRYEWSLECGSLGPGLELSFDSLAESELVQNQSLHFIESSCFARRAGPC